MALLIMSHSQIRASKEKLPQCTECTDVHTSWEVSMLSLPPQSLLSVSVSSLTNGISQCFTTAFDLQLSRWVSAITRSCCIWGKYRHKVPRFWEAITQIYLPSSQWSLLKLQHRLKKEYIQMSNNALSFIAHWMYVTELEPTVSRITQCTLIRGKDFWANYND